MPCQLSKQRQQTLSGSRTADAAGQMVKEACLVEETKPIWGLDHHACHLLGRVKVPDLLNCTGSLVTDGFVVQAPAPQHHEQGTLSPVAHKANRLFDDEEGLQVLCRRTAVHMHIMLQADLHLHILL